MNAWLVVSIAAGVIVGVLVGGVGLALFVGKAIHDELRKSALLAQWRAPAPAGELGHSAAPIGTMDDELEAIDALQAEHDRNFRLQRAPEGPQEARRAPTGDFYGSAKAPGCGYCKRLREAIFGRF